MGGLDYLVLVACMAGTVMIGLVASTKVRTSADLFTAGRQSPWWLAGLSSYMTMFSAATFVVWGSVAYRLGLVAIVINLTYGIAAILVGFFVAGRWRRMGFTTAAEFIELRFGKSALTAFTLLNLLTKMMTVGVGLYALAVMICALMPLADGNFLQDPQTGRLAVGWAIVLLGGLVALYTVAGGLWAVLITDVVQFAVIMISVCFVAPLILQQAGGFSGFVAAAPEDFFLPAQGDWTWWILAGWCMIHFAMIGAEWAFVQRYLCVSSARAAKNVAWLFGALYLLSPALWMLPPMVYRTIDPYANPEQAYILACQAVLPAGCLGLMMAAMASATISAIDSQLNLFAGVLTNDFYKPYLNPRAEEARLVYVGRVVTVLLGGALIAIALVAPRWGGAEELIVKVGSLCVGPLLFPTIWGLFSRKLSTSAMWATVTISITAGIAMFLVQTVVATPSGDGSLDQFVRLVQSHPRHADMIVGLLLPLVILFWMELWHQETSPGWERVAAYESNVTARPAVELMRFPLRVVGWCLIGAGALMGTVLGLSREDVGILSAFTCVLLASGWLCLWIARRFASFAPPSAISRFETSANADSV